MNSEPSRSASIPYSFGGAPAHGRALPPPLPAILTGGVALHSDDRKPLTCGLLQCWGNGRLTQKIAIEFSCVRAAASSFAATMQLMRAGAGFARDVAHVAESSQFFLSAHQPRCLDDCRVRKEQQFQFFRSVLRLSRCSSSAHA